MLLVYQVPQYTNLYCIHVQLTPNPVTLMIYFVCVPASLDQLVGNFTRQTTWAPNGTVAHATYYKISNGFESKFNLFRKLSGSKLSPNGTFWKSNPRQTFEFRWHWSKFNWFRMLYYRDHSCQVWAQSGHFKNLTLSWPLTLDDFEAMRFMVGPHIGGTVTFVQQTCNYVRV